MNLTINVAGRNLIRNASLRFAGGENWAILGANGAGKTLLLHTLAGLRKTDAILRIDENPLRTLGHRERAQYVSLLLQEQAPMTSVTALEAILAARYSHRQPWDWETTEDLALAREALHAVDLDNFENRTLENLSGGERRRCMIAAVLARQTPISLWDEPTNHLDLRHQFSILGLLTQRAKAGVLNIFVLHDVNLAARFCSHALLLHGDGCYDAGTAEAVLTEENLTAIYRYPIRRVDSGQPAYFLPIQ